MNKVQYNDNNMIIYAPDSLKYLTTNIPKTLTPKLAEYKELFNVKEFRKLEMHFFADLAEFRNYVYELRGEKVSLPSYARGVFDKDMIITTIPPDLIMDSKEYERYLKVPGHEAFHIMYKELIWDKNNLERVVWFDEGMAQYFSGQKDDLLNDPEKFNAFLNDVETTTKTIPNLNELQHGKSFKNENYDAYKLSFLGFKYLMDTLNISEIKSLMKDIPKIKEYGKDIVAKSFAYYQNLNKTKASKGVYMPKIIFKPMTKEDNIAIIKDFYPTEDNSDSLLDIYSYLIECFPELKTIDIKKTPLKEIETTIEKVVSTAYQNNKDRIVEECSRYNNLWHKYNDSYFTAITTYLNITWPKDKDTVVALVGIIPVFPRYLETFSFAVSPDLTTSKIIEVAAHETLHFAWFTKWSKLYPNCQVKEYDSPYLPWQYSEMVVDPILNSKEIQPVFNNLFNEKAYDYFYELKDNNTKVMDNIKNIYLENIPIEAKIKKGYDYILELYHKKILTIN